MLRFVFLSLGLLVSVRAELTATFLQSDSTDTRLDRMAALSVPAGQPPTPFLDAGKFETPISPPSGPAQRLFQEHPGESKFLQPRITATPSVSGTSGSSPSTTNVRNRGWNTASIGIVCPISPSPITKPNTIEHHHDQNPHTPAHHPARLLFLRICGRWLG